MVFWVGVLNLEEIAQIYPEHGSWLVIYDDIEMLLIIPFPFSRFFPSYLV